MNKVSIGDIECGVGAPPVLIAGPCVVESEGVLRAVADRVAARAAAYDVPFILKASYDKANRTSLDSFRGPGLEAGLAVIRLVKNQASVPVLIDVHHPAEADVVAQVADVLQIPAFLCRQTDLLTAAARTGRPVNIKKGQWLAPDDIGHAAEKVVKSGNRQVMITERGTAFGYHDWVVDMRSFPVINGLGLPVIFDATHSVQKPGGAGSSSGGAPEFILPLIRAALGAGVDGIFLETHPEPVTALSDGANMLALDEIDKVLKIMAQFREWRAEGGW